MTVLQHVNNTGSKEQYMATMMFLTFVNNIGSKEQYMATLMVLQHVNNISSNKKYIATLLTALLHQEWKKQSWQCLLLNPHPANVENMVSSYQC